MSSLLSSTISDGGEPSPVMVGSVVQVDDVSTTAAAAAVSSAAIGSGRKGTRKQHNPKRKLGDAFPDSSDVSPVGSALDSSNVSASGVPLSYSNKEDILVEAHTSSVFNPPSSSSSK